MNAGFVIKLKRKVRTFSKISGFQYAVMGWLLMSSCSSFKEKPFLMTNIEDVETNTSYISDGSRKVPYKTDAVEEKSEHKEVFERIDDEVERSLRFHPRRGELGFTHVFSERKREILWRKYGIDWHPSTMLNPHIIVD